MTLAADLDTIGWSARELAGRLGCDPKLVRRWVDGVAETPPLVAAWVRKLAIAHRRIPPPEGWRKRVVEG